MITRRYFVTSTAATLFSVGFLPSFLQRASAALAERKPGAGRRRVMVVVFMRGAVDGLNVVVPHGDADYYAARPTIAVGRPGGSSLRLGASEAALDLDGHFGFHPRLSPLKPLFDARELAVVDAAGSPDNTRSHFDAQDYMESATPGVKSTPDGWLNRYLQLGHGEADSVPRRRRGAAGAAEPPRGRLHSRARRHRELSPGAAWQPLAAGGGLLGGGRVDVRLYEGRAARRDRARDVRGGPRARSRGGGHGASLPPAPSIREARSARASARSPSSSRPASASRSRSSRSAAGTTM